MGTKISQPPTPFPSIQALNIMAQRRHRHFEEIGGQKWDDIAEEGRAIMRQLMRDLTDALAEEGFFIVHRKELRQGNE